MKKHIILFSVALLVNLNTNAQVLYSENFDNLTLGNIGTDFNGNTAGQGGWYTKGYGQSAQNNNLYTIENEPNRGKVFVSKIIDIPSSYGSGSHIKKTNINQLIDQRTPGNNVIKFEIEYYTGQLHDFPVFNTNNNHISLNFINSTNQTKSLFQIKLLNHKGDLVIVDYDGNGWGETHILNSSTTKYPVNTWLKINVYIDFNQKYIYYDIPYYGKIVKKTFLNKISSTNLIQDYKPAEILFVQNAPGEIISTNPIINKYNDIKITALNNVPLSVSEFLNEKFNVFPNPATNIVNITNDDNITIDKISIYDVSGKLIKESNYNAENTIQLNIENLQSGNYLLHIETNLGTAVKKIIKQ